jgi:hypothetical protein
VPPPVKEEAAEVVGNWGRGPGDAGVEPLESPPREMTRGAGEVRFFYLAVRFSASKIISFLSHQMNQQRMIKISLKITELKLTLALSTMT